MNTRTDLAALGEALEERIEDVLAGTSRRSQQSMVFGKEIEDRLDGVTRVAGAVIARWIAGAAPDSPRAAGRTFAEVFGGLAAERAIPLDEMIKRCLTWRDTLAEVIVEEADRLDVAKESLDRALTMVRHSTDATIVHVCRYFEGERQRLHGLLEQRQTEATHQATHDSLTGLGNRRALMSDLEEAFARPSREHRLVVALFDLDGFKQYNDTFGHPVGDALLARLGERLATTMDGIGNAYRMGGDEFCVLATVDSESGDAIARLAAAALAQDGEGFDIRSSYGLAIVPDEADSAAAALRLADTRMYAHKGESQASATRQSTDVLLKVLSERSTELEAHISDVARLAQRTAERLGLSQQEVMRIRLAAELHDVGKSAIPDAILNKPDELSKSEWEFVRRHTVIGERIMLAAPALAQSAGLVRASHERLDGSGYPDGLQGEEIPLGARIIAVCDSFDAIVSDRPYRKRMSVSDALAELRRCSGSQFDPHIVEQFCALVEEAGQEQLGLTA